MLFNIFPDLIFFQSLSIMIIWFIKPDFFSNCLSHTSQDNNVLTKHNPSNKISFQTVHHILHKTTMYWPNTTLQPRFLFKMFITYFTRQQCSDQTQPCKSDFFSKCSSHSSQNNNVLTRHNPSNLKSFQNVHHILMRLRQCTNKTQLFKQDIFTTHCKIHKSIR